MIIDVLVIFFLNTTSLLGHIAFNRFFGINGAQGKEKAKYRTRQTEMGKYYHSHERGTCYLLWSDQVKLILAVMSGSFCSFLDLHRVLLHSFICFTFTVAIPYSETSPWLRSMVIINFRVRTVYIIIRWRHTRSQTPLMSSPFHTNTHVLFYLFSFCMDFSHRPPIVFPSEAVYLLDISLSPS